MNIMKKIQHNQGQIKEEAGGFALEQQTVGGGNL